jgi:hypothetical protein
MPDRSALSSPPTRSVSAEAGGAVGHPDHAAAGLIENLQRITTRLIRARADATWRTSGWTACRRWRSGSPSNLVVVVADMARSRSAAPVPSWPSSASACPAQPGAAPGAPLAGAAARRPGPVHRATGPAGEPASGGRPGLGQPQHRQPALPERYGLEGVRGVAESGRGDLRTDPAACTAAWISPPAIAIATRSRRSPGTAG